MESNENDHGSTSTPPNEVELLLPPPEGTASIGVNGGAVTLSHLGPMVVQPDGCLQRIANWDEMTPEEQERTMKIITARNRVRLERLQAQLEAIS
eukprot:GGOE01049213.1.p2 GENE.GGOE01049213.1~~GGOE01049213.1.p2  ORF type:complete len:103 (+),score=14.58 GGOE01049213.1:27-311(+)